MRIKNLGNLLNEIKPLLKQYLEDYGTEFTRTHFQCPNRSRHSDDDTKAACNFYPDESHFKCFVCFESGDIFNACHLLEGRPLAGKGFIRDNVLYLADKYNIPYDLEEESEEEKAYNKAREFVEKLIDNGHKYLKEKKPKIAMDYLKERGWTKIVNTHKIGYLPDNPAMQSAFKKMYKNKYATYINISYKSVVNRLIYPMYNAHGIIIGLSTRVLIEDDSSQKYKQHPLNLTKKPINILYNLNKARKFSKLYLVEGASSIFTLSRNGIDNAVAIMGSHFVEKHYEWLLKNDIKQLVLCFDGDKPGINALADSIKVIQAKSGIKVYVKQLEDNLDPDDYVRKYGVEKFKKVEEIPLFLYQLDNYIDTDETKYRDSLFALLLAEEDGVKREKLLNILTKKTKILKTTLIKELEKYENKHSLMSGISTAAYLEEGIILEKEVDKFDELRWNADELIGLKTGHSIFDEKMDGLQIGLHMVGGRWNVGKCLVGESLVLTNDGLIPIQNYANKEQKEKTFRSFKKKLPAPILESETTHFYYDKSKTIKITLNNGKTLEGTKTHPVFIFKNGTYQWKFLEEINVGDKIISVKGLNRWGDKTKLPKHFWEYKNSSFVFRPKKIPTVLDKNLGYLMGYYIGDGCCNSSNFIIACKPYNTYLQKVFYQTFGFKLKRLETFSYSGGHWARKFFEYLGVQRVTAADKEIPQSILSAPKEIIKYFIQGYLDSDGYIYKREVSFSSKSEKLLRQLQIVFENFGVTTVLHSSINKKYNIKYWYLRLDTNFTNLLKFYKFVVPGYNQNLRKKVSRLRAYLSKNKQPIRPKINPEYIMNTVVNKKYSKKIKKVYDISVKKTHCFIANGIINHNSAFCLDLAIRLIQNPNNYVLYFSIDDPSIFKTIPRMVANISKENVNAVAKPIYAIEKNETLSEDLKVDMSANIEDAINLVRSYSNRFSLKDAKYGQDLKFILQTIRLCKQRALDSENKNLIVFIDFLHMIKVKGDQETEKLIEIAKELKRATSIYECPIVTTVMGTKSGMEARNLKDDSIKGAVELQYEADTINLLETDFYDDKGKMFFYDDEGISRPVISFHVSKNKVMSPFKGKLFYKFYGEQMRFDECDEDEQKKYRKISGKGGYE